MISILLVLEVFRVNNTWWSCWLHYWKPEMDCGPSILFCGSTGTEGRWQLERRPCQNQHLLLVTGSENRLVGNPGKAATFGPFPGRSSHQTQSGSSLELVMARELSDPGRADRGRTPGVPPNVGVPPEQEGFSLGVNDCHEPPMKHLGWVADEMVAFSNSRVLFFSILFPIIVPWGCCWCVWVGHFHRFRISGSGPI